MPIIQVCSGELSQIFPTKSTSNMADFACFSNSVSHEFYQVMVGSPTMSLHGWKQLCEWSIQHSCLSNAEKHQAFKIFAGEWEAFCNWVVKEYGPHADSLDVQL